MSCKRPMTYTLANEQNVTYFINWESVSENCPAHLWWSLCGTMMLDSAK
jgi:hypothetical protein